MSFEKQYFFQYNKEKVDSIGKYLECITSFPITISIIDLTVITILISIIIVVLLVWLSTKLN